MKDAATAEGAKGWMPVALWILPALAAAFYFARPGTSFQSTYAFFWYAVGAVLVAVVGRGRSWAVLLAAALGALGGLYFVANSVAHVTTGGNRTESLYAVGGLVVVVLSSVQLAGAIRREPPIDPIFLAALQLAIGLLTRWGFYGVTGLGLDPNTYLAEDWGTPFRAELPLLALGLAGVGLGVSRDWRPALKRLDIALPAWWQVCLALFVASALLLSNQWFNILTYRLTPNAYYDIGAIEQRDAAAGLGIGLIYALLAGLSEETLFRGALQPRFGILTTALLFAMIHIQYGVTLILIYILVHGLAYGLLRRYVNTTTAIVAHTTSGVIGAVGLSNARIAFILLLTALILAPALARSWRRVFGVVKEGLVEDWSGFWPSGSRDPD